MIAVATNTARRQRRADEALVARRARAALEEHPIFRGRSDVIQINESQGRLVLEGRLPSFYLKQLLQTALRDVEGVEKIDNRVAVYWPVED